MAYTIWNGNGSLVSATKPWTRQAIVSSTNASPIQITTGTHGYNTGDTVEIEGHVTNTAANGIWQVTVTGTTTYLLNGSTGNGVGGATGYSVDYELQPAFQMPANGSLADVNDVVTLGEGLSNTAPFLYRAAGMYRLHDVYTANNSFGVGPTTAWSSTTFTTSSPVALTSAGALFGFSGGAAPVVRVADALEITFQTNRSFFQTAGTQNFYWGPGPLVTGSVPTFVPWMVEGANAPDPAAQIGLVCFSAFVPMTGFITSTQTFDIGLAGALSSPATNSVQLNLWGTWSLTVKHYRAN